MQVNTEQSNTQRMLEHNQKKDRVVAGSLNRSLVNLATNNIDSRESTVLNVFEPAADFLNGAESDVDPQILFKLKFIDKVDCCQISFARPSATERENVSNARIVKLFVNRNDLDFSDLESVPPAVEFELPFEYENEFAKFSLAGSKFTRVSSIQILVDDNFDTDFSRIGQITIEGFKTPTYEYK